LAAKAISPVSFVVYLTEKGVSTAAWVTGTRLKPTKKASHRTGLTSINGDHMTYPKKMKNYGTAQKLGQILPQTEFLVFLTILRECPLQIAGGPAFLSAAAM
jgi:hypothetical protein